MATVCCLGTENTNWFENILKNLIPKSPGISGQITNYSSVPKNNNLGFKIRPISKYSWTGVLENFLTFYSRWLFIQIISGSI